MLTTAPWWCVQLSMPTTAVLWCVQVNLITKAPFFYLRASFLVGHCLWMRSISLHSAKALNEKILNIQLSKKNIYSVIDFPLTPYSLGQTDDGNIHHKLIMKNNMKYLERFVRLVIYFYDCSQVVQTCALMWIEQHTIGILSFNCFQYVLYFINVCFFTLIWLLIRTFHQCMTFFVLLCITIKAQYRFAVIFQLIYGTRVSIFM